MDAEEELFEKFGKLLIEVARDRNIHFFEGFLDQEIPVSSKYKHELDSLTPEQVEMLKEMATHVVDGVIHNMLLLLEDEDWIKLRLLGDDTVIDDIRRAGKGPLQGYIFIWAEKYSTKRLIKYTKR